MAEKSQADREAEARAKAHDKSNQEIADAVDEAIHGKDGEPKPITSADPQA